MQDHPFSDTEKLIRCTVINKYNEETVRLIEFSHFKLWEYLMTHKHGAKISNINLCLWISEDEYLEHENVYSRAGDAEPVTRIIVDLFDEEYGFSNPITRFARNNETEKVIKILRSHIPANICDSDECQIQTYPGYSITQHSHIPRRPLMMGLEE